MSRVLRLTLLAAALALPVSQPTQASDDCTEDAMIVFDGSGSMSEVGFNELYEPRIFEAREAVRRAIPGAAAVRRLGLIVYGPGARRVCDNIDLRFPPVDGAAPLIIAAADGLTPDGNTPLTAAVAMAADVLDYRHKPGAVVLVTDGKETCGGAPCQLAAQLAADGRDLTVHVIGFKVRDRFFSWRSQSDEEVETVAKCLADATGGRYYSPETAQELAEALDDALGCPIVGRLTAGR